MATKPVSIHHGEVLKSVPLDNVHIRDGFNARDMDSEAFRDGVRKLADGIAVDGLLQRVVLRIKPGTKPAEEMYELTGGHRRIAAIQMIRATNPEAFTLHFPDGKVPAIVQAKASDDETEAHMFGDFHSAALDFVDAAAKVKAMADRGIAKDVIAARTGKSAQQIDNYLLFGTLPDDAQGLVKEGLISGRTAVELIRQEGPAAAGVIAAAAADAAVADGRDKATPEDVDTVRERDDVKRDAGEAREDAQQRGAEPSRRPRAGTSNKVGSGRKGTRTGKARQKPEPTGNRAAPAATPGASEDLTRETHPYKGSLVTIARHVDAFLAAAHAGDIEASQVALGGIARWFKSSAKTWNLVTRPKFPQVNETPPGEISALVAGMDLWAALRQPTLSLPGEPEAAIPEADKAA